jgi:hypothetical protein
MSRIAALVVGTAMAFAACSSAAAPTPQIIYVTPVPTASPVVQRTEAPTPTRTPMPTPAPTPMPTPAPVTSECIISIPEPGMTDHTPIVEEFLGWSKSQCAHAIAQNDGSTQLTKAPATKPVCDVINKGTEIRVWGTDAARVACAGLLNNP